MNAFWILVLTVIMSNGEVGGELIGKFPKPEECQLHALQAKATLDEKLREAGKKGVDVQLHCVAHPIPQDKIF